MTEPVVYRIQETVKTECGCVVGESVAPYWKMPSLYAGWRVYGGMVGERGERLMVKGYLRGDFTRPLRDSIETRLDQEIEMRD